MEENRTGIAEIIEKYKGDVEKKNGQEISTSYQPDNASENTMKFPVYDSNFLNFIKVAKNTKFMNKNYMYSYTRKHMKTPEDELKVIAKAQITDMEVLGDILSKYVLKGMTRSVVWSEGIRYGIFYKVVMKMKELIEFWTVPM